MKIIFFFLMIIILLDLTLTQITLDNLPDNYLLIENPDGSISIKNNGNSRNDILEIDNNKFKLDIKSKITIKDNEFKLSGRGDLIIDGKELNGIENALIRTDEERKIVFAEFNSVNGGDYFFDYKNKVFSFKAERYGKILFDPENKKITGENVELAYNEKPQESKFEINGKFSLNLDENGNPKKLIVTDGIFSSNFFGEARQEFFSKNKKPLTVFFDRTDIKDFDGNAISIIDEKDNRIITIKGQVKGNNLKKTVNYEGISENAYTIFHYDGKKGEPGNDPYFDVLEGRAVIDNGKHLAYIEDGKASLRIKNEAQPTPTNFKFTTHEPDKIEPKTEVFINEEAKIFKLTAYDQNLPNGKLTTEVSLSELEKSFSPSLSELAIRKSNEEYLQSSLNQIQYKIDSKEFSGKELQSLELQKIMLENKIDLLNNNIEESIKRMQEFIATNPDSEIKAIAENILGELKLERFLKYRDSYSSSLELKESEKIREHFRKTIAYAKEQLKLDLDIETRNRLLSMKDYAQLNIGKSYFLSTDKSSIDRGIAEANFKLLVDSEIKEVSSEANRLLALSKLSENPSENVQFAL
ncbi:MAG: hypothetical protein AABW90_00205 [Nanoarchaeota archaeon]